MKPDRKFDSPAWWRFYAALAHSGRLMGLFSGGLFALVLIAEVVLALAGVPGVAHHLATTASQALLVAALMVPSWIVLDRFERAALHYARVDER